MERVHSTRIYVLGNFLPLIKEICFILHLVRIKERILLRMRAMRVLRLNNPTRCAKDNGDDMTILMDEIDVDEVDFSIY